MAHPHLIRNWEKHYYLSHLNLKAGVISTFVFMVVVILSKTASRTSHKQFGKIHRIDDSNRKAGVRLIHSVCLNMKDYIIPVADGNLVEKYISCC